MTDFVTKDSGKRAEFAGGMVRDTNEGKMRPDLVADGPMLTRWIGLMTRGAIKYAARNWMLARDQDALDRYRESAFRHFMAWYYGMEDEDHGAAVFFNINGAEHVKSVLKEQA